MSNQNRVSKSLPPSKGKRFMRRMVTFENDRDRSLWLRGQMGASNFRLRQLTGETNGQINYRLKVLKEKLGLKESVRRRWANGHHPLMEQIIRDNHEIMMVELDRKVVPKLVHPQQKMVTIKD